MKRIITIMVFLVAGLVVTTGFDMNSAQGPGGEGVSGDAGTNAGIGPGCECGDIVIQACSHICKDCCCSGYVSWDMSPGIATNEVGLTIVDPSIATIHKDSCDGQDATWKFWPCKSGTYTFYVKGVNPGYTKIHAVLKKNGVICSEAWFDLTVMSISLHEVILPYNFIAIPDKRVADRMGSEVTQDTMTQVKFVYCVLPAGESFDSVDAFLTYDKDGRTLPPLPLNPTYGCDAVSTDLQIQLDNSFMSSQLQHFDVKLRGRKADCAECWSQSIRKDARWIVYDFDMSPNAYAAGGSFCPYSDEQVVPGNVQLRQRYPELGSMPQEKYWGLRMTYSLGANLRGCTPLQSLEEGIHGNSEGMEIVMGDGACENALNVLWCMKTNSTISQKDVKWEGMFVDEPAGEPFFNGENRVRESNIFTYAPDPKYANIVPDRVASERLGVSCRLSATEDPDPFRDNLYARHRIRGLTVNVKYKY